MNKFNEIKSEMLHDNKPFIPNKFNQTLEKTTFEAPSALDIVRSDLPDQIAQKNKNLHVKHCVPDIGMYRHQAGVRSSRRIRSTCPY